ncbi:MAG: hypothetical protein KGL02_06790 [Acidobacteriota bacterium]|nr:hypothetical protein [Acidobacteriota bacterium]
MADWRQIQARIRKAKSGRDPSAKLSELYQRTRDAMVAWELGAIEEKAEHQGEAAKWYTIAAQRFRRADWKKKAEEALTRLGAPHPAEHAELPREIPAQQAHAVAPSEREPLPEIPEMPEIPVEEPDYESQIKFFGAAGIDQRREDRISTEGGEITPSDVRAAEPQVRQPAPAAGDESGRRRRRRGRRGGRGRRRGAGGQGLPAHAFTAPAESRPAQAAAEAERGNQEASVQHPPQQPLTQEELADEPPGAAVEATPAPRLPSERIAHGRAGDPGLASRMNQLESLLRRLLGGALHRVSEADEAPAGPGVFVLSDSDQTTSYYVEACQTLRVGVANLVRGRGGKGRPNARGFGEIDLKAKLAEHLGISESKVSDYLKNHCVVRWIQLDEEAPHLAHFAVAVLRTPLNLG